MFMLFEESDVSKRISRLERDMSRRMQRLEESFLLTKQALIRMKKENIELKNDRDFLLQKYRDLLGRLPAAEIQAIIEPVKQAVAENARFFEKVAKHGLVSKQSVVDDLKKEHKAPLDELFIMVTKNKKLKLSEAAKKLRVDGWKVEQWARVLERHELIDVQYPEEGEIFLEKR